VNTFTQRTGGFSLIEFGVALAVLAIALTFAVPSWKDGRNRHQLTSTAEQVAAFLSTVQGASVRQNDALTVRLIQNSSTDWCIGVAPRAVNCDCTVTDPTDASFCAVSGMPQIVRSGDFKLTLLPGHSSDTSFTFEPARGLMIDADLGKQHFFNFASEDGNYALRVDVLPTGRIKVCNFDPDRHVFHYDAC
jgi:Tfp pilus assembly protein FimT